MNCDFFWGWNIQFEYVHKSFPYKFHWQSWGWIDMYEGDIRLIDKKTPFTDKLVIDACLINTTEDLTRELERCINDYMEYKKFLLIMQYLDLSYREDFVVVWRHSWRV